MYLLISETITLLRSYGDKNSCIRKPGNCIVFTFLFHRSWYTYTLHGTPPIIFYTLIFFKDIRKLLNLINIKTFLAPVLFHFDESAHGVHLSPGSIQDIFQKFVRRIWLLYPQCRTERIDWKKSLKRIFRFLQFFPSYKAVFCTFNCEANASLIICNRWRFSCLKWYFVAFIKKLFDISWYNMTAVEKSLRLLYEFSIVF